jgi:ABC-type multidrug transport system ATPase subunit
VVLGENGAGKSTLLRVLLGTVLPDSGSAEICGHDVRTDRRGASASIGFVMGSERAWELRLSGRENLRFFAALYHRRPDPAVVDALLDEVGLADAADRMVGTYSSGMRLRLGLARALLHRPPVLLLDEPTSALDPVAKAGFHAMLRERLQRDRTAVLYATHDLHEAAEIADLVVIMRDGRLAVTLAPPLQPSDLAAALQPALVAT